jgi:carotenoid 1,2-hydratase
MPEIRNDSFSVISSVGLDVHHPSKPKAGYEWWYFDAISDDGRDAVVIIFLENFVFSPRYNSAAQSRDISRRFPALAFFHYRDGKPIHRVINEYDESEFASSESTPSCRIGGNVFTVVAEKGGLKYIIDLDLTEKNARPFKAHYEFDVFDRDVFGETPQRNHAAHEWNLVAPRCKVYGYSATSQGGSLSFRRDFRGIGYHDHNLDSRWLPDTVRTWDWGRVHLEDATVVFYDFTSSDGGRVTKLFRTVNGVGRMTDCTVEEHGSKRDAFGLSYPRQVVYKGDDGMTLTVSNSRPVDSSFFYLRFVNDVTVTTPSGKTVAGRALTERLVPHALRFRWLDWLVDMRIGRDGKGAFLK